jgi:hypothetical protein
VDDADTEAAMSPHRAIPPLAVASIAWASLLGLLVSSSALAGEPSEYEQYMIELVNRARLDPEGEVARLGTGSLNEGPPSLNGWPYTIPAGPRQPLAVNPAIADATIDYAQLMNDSDTFCHTCLGTNSSERMWSAGYVPFLSDFNFLQIAGYTLNYGGAPQPGCSSSCAWALPGRENISFLGEWPANGMMDDLLGGVEQAHASLFNDFGVPGRGHRSTLLYGEWKEIGIGIVEGTDAGGSQDSVYIVQNFAHRSDTGPFLTGVAYDDLDQDGFYTPDAGEALAGVNLTIYEADTSNVVATGSTLAAGGYSVALGIGVYDVVASSSALSESYEGVAILGSGPGGIGENTKLDVIPLPEPDATLALAAGLLTLGVLKKLRGDPADARAEAS